MSKKKTCRKARKLDAIEQAIVDCHLICEQNGVILFSIGVGDKSTYQTYRRKIGWRQWCRLRDEVKAQKSEPK